MQGDPGLVWYLFRGVIRRASSRLVQMDSNCLLFVQLVDWYRYCEWIGDINLYELHNRSVDAAT
jgi:hypothetical protein